VAGKKSNSEGRLPPQNVEAEQSVLGAILLDGRSLDNALEILREGDFYKPAHAVVFRAMLALADRGEPIDLVTLKDQLQGAGALAEVGGASYLASLLDMVPTSANVRHHCRIVREKSIRRQLIHCCGEIAEDSFGSETETEDLLDRSEEKIFRIGEQKIKQSFFPMRQVVKEAFEHIERLFDRQDPISGLATGFTDFDRMTAGLQKSDLIIIAGRPSMGKTSFCLNIAEHVALSLGLPVAIFSLEMSREQLAQRMLCSEARVDAQALRTGFLRREDFPRLTLAVGRLAEAPIFIDDSASASVLEIKAKSRRLQKEHENLALIVIDYLQLMRGHEKKDSRQQEISDISRALKGLAKELKIPVVALSQLSRAPESRGRDRRPQLSDLRESGAIEQDADVVAFIYREEYYEPDDPEVKGLAEVIIRKQRNGPAGTVKLAFLHEFTKFANLDRRY
jgi:replicative DNA helicase